MSPGFRVASAGLAIVTVLLGEGGPAAAQDRSPIVLNCDGLGTTIAKPVGETLFQVQSLWRDNSVNGIQGFPDGSFAFVNCSPERRTVAETDLACRVYDPLLASWSAESIATTIGRDFLDGPYENPLDSLGEVSGEYLTLFELGDEAYSFRLLFGDGIRTQPGGVPVLIGQSAPPSQSFLVRDVDRPGGALGATNFTIGIQYEDRCFDFAVTPNEPGGILIGTLTARERAADGSCGDTLAENLPAALIPSASRVPVGSCSYRIMKAGTCSPANASPVPIEGARLCLFCSGTCRDFTEPISFLYRNPDYRISTYIDCLDFEVQRETSTCGEAPCDDGLPAITLLSSLAPPAAVDLVSGRQDQASGRR